MNDSRRAVGTDPDLERQLPGTPLQSTYLAIRLWTPARTKLEWTADCSLIYLLSDVVTNSNGVCLPDTGAGLAAQFDEPAQALRAAKRIQWSLLEFCEHRPDQCSGAAILIYDPADIPREESSSEILGLLEQGKPAQVLAAGNSKNQLREIPGLQSHAFPASQGNPSAWQRGAQELLWTTPANLEHVQQALRKAEQLRKEVQLTADNPTVDLSTMNQRAHQPTLVHRDAPAPVEAVQTDLLTELEPSELPASGSGSRTVWWVLAGIVLLGVVAGAVLIPQIRRKSVVIDNPPVAQPAGETEPATPPPSPQPSEKASDVTTTPAATTDHAASDVPRTQIKKTNVYEGMSDKDIPMLLRMAEKDAGDGKYEDARRKFEIVLRIDANNKQAKEGLHKLELTERESR